MSKASVLDARLTTVTLLAATLSLFGAAGCATDLESGEPASTAGAEDDSKTNASEPEGATDTVSQALPIGGGGATGSSCSEPPLHCAGKASIRGVYPGCSVTCKTGETAMCLAGDCFWHRSASCTCMGAIYYPQ